MLSWFMHSLHFLYEFNFMILVPSLSFKVLSINTSIYLFAKDMTKILILCPKEQIQNQINSWGKTSLIWEAIVVLNKSKSTRSPKFVGGVLLQLRLYSFL